MGFIEREITEEDKKWLEQFRIVDPFSSRFEPNYGKRIIEDKEEEAILVCLGGQGYMEEKDNFYSDLPLVFYLIWNGYCLYVECHYETYKMSEEPSIYGAKYIVETIRNRWNTYPERDIEYMKKRIKELLKESLAVYRGFYSNPFGKVEFLKLVEPRCL